MEEVIQVVKLSEDEIIFATESDMKRFFDDMCMNAKPVLARYVDKTTTPHTKCSELMMPITWSSKINDGKVRLRSQEKIVEKTA